MHTDSLQQSAHPGEPELQYRNIYTSYLPPNVTAVIQSIVDQRVIQNVKCHYRKREFSPKTCKLQIFN